MIDTSPLWAEGAFCPVKLRTGTDRRPFAQLLSSGRQFSCAKSTQPRRKLCIYFAQVY